MNPKPITLSIKFSGEDTMSLPIEGQAEAAVGAIPTDVPDPANINPNVPAPAPAQDDAQPDGGTEFDSGSLLKAQGRFIHAQMMYLQTGDQKPFLTELLAFVNAQNLVLHDLGII